MHPKHPQNSRIIKPLKPLVVGRGGAMGPVESDGWDECMGDWVYRLGGVELGVLGVLDRDESDVAIAGSPGLHM